MPVVPCAVSTWLAVFRFVKRVVRLVQLHKFVAHPAPFLNRSQAARMAERGEVDMHIHTGE